MKTILLTIAVVTAAALSATAQTFSGPVTITGTTNAPLYIAGAIPTNGVTITLPAKQFTLGGIANTGEVATLSYGVVVVGTTNFIPFGSISTNFAAGTNGGSWSPTIPAATYQFQFVTYGQAAIGTNTNTIFAP